MLITFILQTTLIFMLLLRCNLLQKKYKDLREYINFGTQPKYNIDLIGEPIKPKYRKETKNVLGTIIRTSVYGDLRYIYIKVDNYNSQIIKHENKILYATLDIGSKVELIETLLIDNKTNVIIEMKYGIL